MAVAWKEQGHIQLLQAFHRAELLLEIPPAVTLRSDNDRLRRTPPEVITAEEHLPALTQQDGHGSRRVPGAGDQLHRPIEGHGRETADLMLSPWSGIGIGLALIE